MTGDAQIIKADQRLRRNLMLFVAAAFVVGMVTLFLLQNYLHELKALAQNDPEQALDQVLRLVQVVKIVNTILLSLLALFFMQLSLRTYRARQYPPPGTRVFKSQKVVRGKGAQLRGAVGMAIAVALLALAYYSVHIFTSIEREFRNKMPQKNASLDASPFTGLDSVQVTAFGRRK